MRLRRPVVHHGAVALSSGSLYQARPALQSIPRLAPRKGRPSHMRIDWRIALPVSFDTLRAHRQALTSPQL